MVVKGILIRPMIGKRCWSPKRKIRYQLLSEAVAEAIRLSRRNRGREVQPRPLTCYWCAVHQAWHVGHERTEQGPRELISLPGLAECLASISTNTEGQS